VALLDIDSGATVFYASSFALFPVNVSSTRYHFTKKYEHYCKNKLVTERELKWLS